MSYINLILRRIISVHFYHGLLLFVYIALMSVDLSSLTKVHLVTASARFWYFNPKPRYRALVFFSDLFVSKRKNKNQDKTNVINTNLVEGHVYRRTWSPCLESITFHDVRFILYFRNRHNHKNAISGCLRFRLRRQIWLRDAHSLTQTIWTRPGLLSSRIWIVDLFGEW